MTLQADQLVGLIVLERYQLKERIAVGQTGAIYRAEHVNLHHPLAVKIYHRALCDDNGLIKRIRHDLTQLAQLTAPAIIRPSDIGTTPQGQLFAAMEFVEGQSLATLMQHGPLGSTRALVILAQLCEALHECHTVRIAHGDLSPRNVLITHYRDRDLVKLVGLDSGGVGIHHIGNSPYAAPELSKGYALDGRSDIYALGRLALELVAGTDAALDPVDAFAQMAGRAEAVDITMAYQSAVHKALRREPVDRFATVHEFFQACHPGGATKSGPLRVTPTKTDIARPARLSGPMPQMIRDGQAPDRGRLHVVVTNHDQRIFKPSGPLEQVSSSLHDIDTSPDAGPNATSQASLNKPSSEHARLDRTTPIKPSQTVQTVVHAKDLSNVHLPTLYGAETIVPGAPGSELLAGVAAQLKDAADKRRQAQLIDDSDVPTAEVSLAGLDDSHPDSSAVGAETIAAAEVALEKPIGGIPNQPYASLSGELNDHHSVRSARLDRVPLKMGLGALQWALIGIIGLAIIVIGSVWIASRQPAAVAPTDAMPEAAMPATTKPVKNTPSVKRSMAPAVAPPAPPVAPPPPVAEPPAINAQQAAPTLSAPPAKPRAVRRIRTERERAERDDHDTSNAAAIDGGTQQHAPQPTEIPEVAPPPVPKSDDAQVPSSAPSTTSSAPTSSRSLIRRPNWATF